MKNKNQKPIIAFVHIPKTAGTTFTFVLRNSFGLSHCDISRFKKADVAKTIHLEFAKKVFPFLKSIAGHTISDPVTNLPEYVMPYTFLRNPLERCASSYQDNVRRSDEKRSFEEWIKNPEQHNVQTQMIAGKDDIKRAKALLEKKFFFTGLFEKYHESLIIFNHLSPYKIKLAYQKQNVFSDNEIKNQILSDKKSLGLLKKYNKNDIELYEYVLKVIFPKQIKNLDFKINPDIINQNLKFGPKAFLCELYNKNIWRQLSKFYKPGY